ncbi:hypothetical protein B2J93_756 [Marssonina coronariae]|uniref:Uncharacterized protein n=1 Tax=Diplocarpon coronariae TaxID=2795749 RepID=A0A218YZH2_9HELO|nr:hypothetical protein B2J93_756 [Marssonina coronariae]
MVSLYQVAPRSKPAVAVAVVVAVAVAFQRLLPVPVTSWVPPTVYMISSCACVGDETSAKLSGLAQRLFGGIKWDKARQRTAHPTQPQPNPNPTGGPPPSG